MRDIEFAILSLLIALGLVLMIMVAATLAKLMQIEQQMGMVKWYMGLLLDRRAERPPGWRTSPDEDEPWGDPDEWKSV